MQPEPQAETWTDAPAIGTIMIVDDDSLDQMLTRRVLERSGLVGEIVQYQSPEDAVAFLVETRRPGIDIILLDVNMPRMDGFEFLEAATKACGPDFAECVVVMLTTSLHPLDVERADAFSVVKDYFAKPLSVDDVPRMAALLSA